MKYKVSIIMPVFNVECYLKNALDSIISQTMDLSDIQVILVNDASTDSSGSIIDSYNEKYDNFRIIHLKNNSGSAAKPRNVALKYVDAEYVMFLDPDDEYCDDYCEIMYNTIKKYDVNLVKCNLIEINDKGIHKNYYFNQNIDEKVIYSYDDPLKLVSICNGIHNYDFIMQNDISFPEKCFGEDIFFSVKEHLCMDKLIFLNNYFGYKYYDRTISHSKSPSYDNIINILNVFYFTRDLCEKYSREDIIKIVLGQQIIGLYFRIRNVEGRVNKYSLLKEVSLFLNTSPKLIVPNKIYKISNILLERKLINLTVFYFTLVNILSNSKILQKLIS